MKKLRGIRSCRKANQVLGIGALESLSVFMELHVEKGQGHEEERYLKGVSTENISTSPLKSPCMLYTSCPGEGVIISLTHRVPLALLEKKKSLNREFIFRGLSLPRSVPSVTSWNFLSVQYDFSALCPLPSPPSFSGCFLCPKGAYNTEGEEKP